MAKNTDDILKERVRGIAFQRNFEFETHDADGNVTDDISVDDWVARTIDEILALIGDDDQGAVVVHNRDMVDGKPKPVHIHGVIRFKNARTRMSLMNALNITRIENLQKVRTYAGAYRYLTHITDEAIEARKFIYPVSDVIVRGTDEDGNPLTYQDLIVRGKTSNKGEAQEAEAFVIELHSRIQSGELLTHDVMDLLLARFSDEVAFKTWHRFNAEMKRDEDYYIKSVAMDMQSNGRDLTTAFFSGPSASGKTTIARAVAHVLADVRGVHFPAVASHTTPDMVSTYQGELVTVLDEFAGNSFDLRHFLNVFDPYSYTPVASRGNDKDWLARYAFFTYAEGFENWVDDLLLYTRGGRERRDSMADEDELNTSTKTQSEYKQVVRRFKYLVDLTPVGSDEIELKLYRFNLERWRHELIGSFTYDKSILTQGYQHEPLVKLANQIVGLMSDETSAENEFYPSYYIDKIEGIEREKEEREATVEATREQYVDSLKNQLRIVTNQAQNLKRDGSHFKREVELLYEALTETLGLSETEIKQVREYVRYHIEDHPYNPFDLRVL